jgi:membrane protein DedA with SNARE-associated domain
VSAAEDQTPGVAEPTDDRETVPDRADPALDAPDTSAPDPNAPDPNAPTDGPADAEKEWWDDPRMPWKGKPGRADILCWAGFSVSGIIGLIMIPLRPILIAHNVLLLVAITGSRSGLVTTGALAAVGRADWWPIALVVGILSCVKWDPLFWWAGKLWGRGLIDVVAGRSKWAAKNADRAERLARRFAVPAVLLAYIVPLPAAVIYATVGMAGMRLRTFLAVDLFGSVVLCSLYVYLGHRLGQHAVDVVEVIARYSGYISIGLLVIIIGQAVWRAKRKAATA